MFSLDRQSSGSEYIQELSRTNWPNLPTSVGTSASSLNQSYVGTYQKTVMKICSAWPTSPSLWCPTPTLDTTSMVRLWKMFCCVLEGKQSFKIYGFHNGGIFFLGKSAHGAADTDMAGLLGQLQVIMPWHWPIINIVPKSLIVEISTSGKRTIFVATEVSPPAPTTRPLLWAFHTSWEPTMTRLTIIDS